MSAKFIVVVSDRDDSKRAEITVADNPRTAAHLVETLLEAGFERERIQLYTGHQTEMRVSSRPVVALVDELSTASGPGGRPAVALAAPEESSWKASEEEAVPFVKDGVRFSSLFRAS